VQALRSALGTTGPPEWLNGYRATGHGTNFLRKQTRVSFSVKHRREITLTQAINIDQLLEVVAPTNIDGTKGHGDLHNLRLLIV
jgi:hypothetical protein